MSSLFMLTLLASHGEKKLIGIGIVIGVYVLYLIIRAIINFIRNR